MDLPTESDLVRIAQDTALGGNSALVRAVVERDGSDANVLTAAVAAPASEVVTRVGRVAAGLFLDSARGDALRRLVFDRFNLRPKDAAPALCSVRFSTTTPAPVGFSIPAGTELVSQRGVSFVTTATVNFAAGQTVLYPVPVRSVLAGLNQATGASQIAAIVSTIAGAPDDLAVTNPLATSGADDEESEASLRERARQFYVTARRGTLQAIEAAAVGVPGVRSALAMDAVDAQGRPARWVQLVVTDAFSEQLVDLTSVPYYYSAQSQQLRAVVFRALDDVRAGGIYVEVVVGQVVLVPIHLRLAFQAGANPDVVTSMARAVIVNAVNARPPGTRLVLADLAQLLAAVPGLVYTGTEIASPPGDVVPSAVQVIRTAPALVGVSSATPGTLLLPGTFGQP